MPKRVPAELNESVPPSERLALKQDAKESLTLASELVKSKKYKEAFKQYKEALAKAESNEIFPFPHWNDIATLAKKYRPALVALKKWRNQKEKLILEEMADSTVISQWDSLNDCLNERDRILTVFRKLKDAGANEELIRSFYWKVWKTLVKKRQYEELGPFCDTLGWMTLLGVSDYHAEKWFPRGSVRARDSERIIAEGALVYETVVALQAFEAAAVIEEKLLSVDDGDATYAALIKAARRARAREQAKRLYEQARERLGGRRVRKSAKALGTR